MLSVLHNDVTELQSTYGFSLDLITTLTKDPEAPPSKKGFSLKGNTVLYKNRIYAPEGPARGNIFTDYHDSKMAGHPGLLKTIKSIQRNYMWPNIKKDTKAYIEGCEVCCKTKPRRARPEGLLNPLSIPEGPWKSVSLDYIVELPKSDGYNAILVMVDRFTKMAYFAPTTTNCTASETAKLLFDHVMTKHSVPKELVTDRGPQFTSSYWAQVTQDLGIQKCTSTSYHPQTDSQTKRFNQILEQYLQCYVNARQDNWSALLTTAQLAYNSKYHLSTKMSPFMANYGFEPCWDPQLNPYEANQSGRSWIALIKETHKLCASNLNRAVATYKAFADRARTPGKDLEVDNEVYLDNRNIPLHVPSRKLAHRRSGPFRIIEKIGNVAYQLELHPSWKIHNVFHRLLLHKCLGSSLPHQKLKDPPPTIKIGRSLEYKVDFINNQQTVNAKTQYLVKWKG